MTTRPSLHAWLPAHWMRSAVSRPSCWDSSCAVPSERPHPRRSALITTKPCATHHAGSGASHPVSAENWTGAGWRKMRY